MSDTTPLLELEEVGFTIAEERRISDWSLRLEAGERVALVAPSGYGKTTALRVICGLRSHDAGAIRLRGKTGDAIGWPAFRRQVVMLAQRPVMFDEDVLENLRRSFHYASAEGADFPEERALELLEGLGLGGSTEVDDARDLSAGEQQRVALVRAMLIEPAVWLLDEPTSALDEAAADDALDLIADDLESRGAACLWVSHDRALRERWSTGSVDLTELGSS